MPRQSKLYRHARIQRIGHYHGSHIERHQPLGKNSYGPGARTEKQRVQTAVGHYGKSRRWRKRRAHSVQHEPQAVGNIIFKHSPPPPPRSIYRNRFVRFARLSLIVNY